MLSEKNVLTTPLVLTRGEATYCEAIRGKDHALRTFLVGSILADPADARQWLAYLSGIKHALGNLNNDVSFVATLLVKRYRATLRDQ